VPQQPHTSGRRSSSYAKTGGPKNEPRPIGDKGYQANCIRALIAYLSTHGYDQPLTPKLLANPMGKDVNAIMQFLMRQARACRKPPLHATLAGHCLPHLRCPGRVLEGPHREQLQHFAASPVPWKAAAAPAGAWAAAAAKLGVPALHAACRGDTTAL
jgi:hypothetical protein